MGSQPRLSRIFAAPNAPCRTAKCKAESPTRHTSKIADVGGKYVEISLREASMFAHSCAE